MPDIERKCRKCGVTKTLDCFAKCSRSMNGRQHLCKSCAAEEQRAIRQRRSKRADIRPPSEKCCRRCQRSKLAEDYYRDVTTADGLSALCKLCDKKARKQRRLANPTQHRAYQRAYYAKNAPQLRAYYKARNKRTKQATPVWVDYNEVQELFNRAQLASSVTRIAHHVDHIIPLNSHEVCGLNVPWNLRVIPSEDNQSKGNRYLQAQGVAPCQLSA